MSEHVVPASVLDTALVTKLMRTSYTIEDQDSGDYAMRGGLDVSFFGEYVSGDPGCRTFFSPHPVDVASFAYVSMSSKTIDFTEVVESYPTLAEAKRVTGQNVVEARNCHTFKMRDTGYGETVTYRHTVTAKRHGDVDLFLHHFSGSTKKWIYEFHMFEGRSGGEMVHVLWASSGTRGDPSSAAFTQFQKVINAYRRDHPRQGGGADGGASPLTAAPTGAVWLAPRTPSRPSITQPRVP